MTIPLRYFRADTLQSALDFMAKSNGNLHLLAGGTDLLINLRKKRNGKTETLLDINFLPELKRIDENKNQIKIGAAVTHTQLQKSDLINRFAPLLAEAVATIGSVQIRNRGTLGGNICNASPCADSAPALLALDTKVEIRSQSKIRLVNLSDFFSYPYKTILKKNEIVSNFILPKSSEKKGFAFLKLGRRNAMSIARMNVAVQIGTNKKGEINFSRIAVGSVFPTTSRVEKAEDILIDEQLSEELFLEAGNLVSDEMIKVTGRRWSSEYKEPVIRVLVKRALMRSWEKLK